ncbi:MAG: peptidoglycan-binding protein [Oscillatoriophycideae cyanobacterium NC_groundwater_1537_Pr4_S-0.65um_50_18]|nr:peptidoglycan-binding protein [Oscillatoriophycideae cyanobacterium NC_groundwater_1537_Pr4_S-0.65um_50_18]
MLTPLILFALPQLSQPSPHIYISQAHPVAEASVLTPNYTHAQLRSILNGLDFSSPPEDEASFPLTQYDGAMIDWVTIDAVKAFQTYFQLEVDGIAGSQTKAMAAKAMRILQADLNLVMKLNPPLSADQPFFDLRTIEAVRTFQRSYGLSPANGVANLPTRLKLRQMAQSPTLP